MKKTTSMILEIKKLSKTFSSKVVLDHVDLALDTGEFYALVGPNGSGKTTLIRCISGILRVTDGEIRIMGENVVENPVRTKQHIGYIPDEPVVWPAMTGEEFLHFSGALHGMAPDVRRERIDALLPLFHLDGMEHEAFGGYSRGTKQKFSILAAMLHHPRLLLIDEPIVGLDPASAEIATNIFRKFQKDGGAILMVTHTLSVAQSTASRIGILRAGSLIAEGSLPALRTRAGVASDASLEAVYSALS
ncbi:MAG: ABC transporter ATP-binding protein [Parcubacteria group bacterium]|nr:ABC transporter ATP-binding protein [Parcubacteria group bacterium]